MQTKRIRKMAMKKKLLAAALAVGLALGTPYGAPKAEAFWGDWGGIISDVIGGVVNADNVRSNFLALGNNPVVQNDLALSRVQKASTAAREVDPRSVSLVDALMKKMVGRGDYVLRNNSLPFRWKTVPNDSFNASCDFSDFIVIHDGLVKNLHYNPDEIAAVLGHEMAHGYNQHVANDAHKKALTSVFGNLALNAASIANIGVGYALPEQIINFAAVKNISVATEKRADRSGFFTMASAGFNPGGPAAAMARMSYFTEHPGQVADFFDPSDHPQTRARVKEMAQYMTDYGINHPSVQNVNDVYIDKTLLLTAEEDGGFDAEEMAYLIAGGIARGFHDNKHVTDWNFRTLPDGKLDFLTKDRTYEPLKNAINIDKETATRFQTLVEAAYAADAKSNARMTYPKLEKEHLEDMRKAREEQAKRTDDSYMKSNNGTKYMQLGLTDLAEQEFTRAGKLDAKNSLAKSGMATVFAKRGNYDEAMRLANEAVAMAPAAGENYVNRATVYRMMGDLDSALNDCNLALSVKNKSVAAYRVAGEIFDAQGATTSALEEFRAYHQADPSALDIPETYMAQLK